MESTQIPTMLVKVQRQLLKNVTYRDIIKNLIKQAATHNQQRAGFLKGWAKQIGEAGVQ